MAQQIEVDQGFGRKKRIERALAVNCLLCGISVECPDDEDFWFWLKSDAVERFREEHAHGIPRLVGAEIRIEEKE